MNIYGIHIVRILIEKYKPLCLTAVAVAQLKKMIFMKKTKFLKNKRPVKSILL
jgi:hypothetical protein